MSEKRFICMFVLAAMAGLFGIATPVAAIGPALMVVVLGFDGVCLALAAGTRSAETCETAAQSEGCQSGGDSRIAQGTLP